ncbi:MAG: heme ABC exporter ATP-binding protein CcmA [Candidatus Binataceae bacterium]
MDGPLIEARGLDKNFGISPVLRNVNLKVRGGCGALIVGRNGAGKSTLVRILAGLSAPSSGQALLFGLPGRELEPAWRRRVGLLTHQSFLYPNLTAVENLQFYAELYRFRLDGRALEQWLKRIGLTAFAKERVRTFSRGMEQRLALARAMLAVPDALLMDEPFAALDADGAKLVTSLLREALTRGCAAVITAHEPLQLDGMTLEVRELVRGRLMAPSESFAKPRSAMTG